VHFTLGSIARHRFREQRQWRRTLKERITAYASLIPTNIRSFFLSVFTFFLLLLLLPLFFSENNFFFSIFHPRTQTKKINYNIKKTIYKYII
jgi:hypothetical protein